MQQRSSARWCTRARARQRSSTTDPSEKTSSQGRSLSVSPHLFLSLSLHRCLCLRCAASAARVRVLLCLLLGGSVALHLSARRRSPAWPLPGRSSTVLLSFSPSFLLRSEFLPLSRASASAMCLVESRLFGFLKSGRRSLVPHLFLCDRCHVLRSAVLL